MDAMPAPRKTLEMKNEGQCFVTRFRHPCTTDARVVRVRLGRERSEAQAFLSQLNTIFLHPQNWHNKPTNVNPEVWNAWRDPLGGVVVSKDGVTVDGQQVTKGGDPRALVREAALQAKLKFKDQECVELRRQLRTVQKQLEHALGKKLRSGPCPTLKDALKDWLSTYTGHDSHHTRCVKTDLERFIRQFGEDTPVDEMEGAEKRIDGWINGIKAEWGKRTGKTISAGRRKQLQQRIRRFLTDSGALLNQSGFTKIKGEQVKRDRGLIVWLERDEINKLLEHLEQPWKDAFQLQVETGLRPEELGTLRKDNFDDRFTKLTLSPLKPFELKTGTRTLHLTGISDKTRTMIQARLAANDILFPQQNGEPWVTEEWFYRSFNRALKTAGKNAKIASTKPLDCRTGRRTFGSLVLRGDGWQKMNEVDLAQVMGNSPRTVRLHYAALLDGEVKPQRASE